MGKLINAVEDLGSSTSVCVFLDVNPRNSNTEASLKRVMSALSENPNAFVIPIIGIEEAVLKLFEKSGGLDDLFDFRTIDNWGHIIFKSNESFEVLFKRLIKQGTDAYYCLKNRNIKKHPGAGYYFKCSCTDSCKAMEQESELACPLSNSTSLSLDKKGTLLWSCLPVYRRVTGESSYSSTLDLANAVAKERKEYYLRLCNAFGITPPSWVVNMSVYPYALHHSV